MTMHFDLRERLPALPVGARILLEALASASKPVEQLTVSEHAERYRKVSPESGSPWPGDFKVQRVPYIRQPEDCLHPDHPARSVRLRWAAQVGKSTIVENWFCFIVDRAPGSMMIVLPTMEEATKFNRVKLQPTIEASPAIRHKVLPVSSRDEQGSTTSFKRFAGGFCQIVNAGSSKGLQMVSIKYLAMDEVTGYPLDVDGRGSPRDQARARQKMYGDLAKELEVSTPGEVGTCVISHDFEDGDQRSYYVPCPHCSEYQALLFSQMRGADRDLDLPVHFRCLRCDGVILDGHKPEMMARAEWIALRINEGEAEVPKHFPPEDLAKWNCLPCEGRCKDWQPSFDLWAAYAPRERWADIWKRWEDAQGDTQKLKTFMQQDLAKPYDPTGVSADWEKIVETTKTITYLRGTLPPWAGTIVSAADVQSYGIKWAAFSAGPRDKMQLIDKEIFEGAPDQVDDPWIGLSDALERTYRVQGNRERPIDLSGIDSGFATSRVYLFTRGRPNVLALDGRARKPGASWVGSPTRQKVKDARGKVIARELLYPVYSHDIKTAVMAALANFTAGPDQLGIWPRNTLLLPPELADEAFVKEITAERLVDPAEEARTSVSRRARHLINPHAPHEWKRIVGRQNDWLDVSVYAKALAWLLQHRMRLTEDSWADLLREIHGPEIAVDLFSAADNVFAPRPAQVAAPPRPRPALNDDDWF